MKINTPETLDDEGTDEFMLYAFLAALLIRLHQETNKRDRRRRRV
jgi:hypothetical protein